MNDELCFPQRSVTDFNGDGNLFNPVYSSQLMYPDLDFNMVNAVCNGSMINGRVPSSISSMADGRGVELLPVRIASLYKEMV